MHAFRERSIERRRNLTIIYRWHSSFRSNDRDSLSSRSIRGENSHKLLKKKGKEWGEKSSLQYENTRGRGWNVAVNSGWRDVRISSYVWRPYFFHDTQRRPANRIPNFGTAPNYYRPVCFTLCPIGTVASTPFPVTSFSLRITKGLRKFSNRFEHHLEKPSPARRETWSIAFSTFSFEFQIYLDPPLLV